MTTTLGTRRRPGRPRDPHLADRAFDATTALLAEGGFAALSMDRIAARAGVAKATLYARWPSKADLVVAAVAHRYGGALPAAPDTGDVREDLVALLGAFCAAMRGDYGRVMAPLIGGLTHDPDLAATFRHEFVEPRRRRVRQALERGRARGQLRSGADLDVLADAGAAMVFLRLLVTGEELDEGLPDRLVRQLLDPWLVDPSPEGRS